VCTVSARELVTIDCNSVELAPICLDKTLLIRSRSRVDRVFGNHRSLLVAATLVGHSTNLAQLWRYAALTS
jgi:hypothetical protein